MSSSSRNPQANQDLEQGIELGNMARFSTETQRRNGERHSKDPDHTVRILEDLINIVYDCPICVEKIQPNIGIWHCKCCYRVFHYECTKEWALTSREALSFCWKCPMCHQPQPPIQKSTCWCGREKFPNHHMTSMDSLPPNTCRKTCGLQTSAENCPHKHRCEKDCHPGPCSTCPRCPPGSESADGPRDIRTESISWTQFLKRWIGIIIGFPLLILFGLLVGLLLLLLELLPVILFNGGLVAWVVMITKRITQPYNHPDWITQSIWYWHQMAQLIIVAVCVTFNAFIVWCFLRRKYHQTVLPTLPNTDSRKIWFWGLSLIPLVLSVVWLPLAFYRAPAVVWYNQMKHSCDGFDTRVSLDSISPLTNNFTPNTTLLLHAPGQSPTLPPLYIGSHIVPTTDPLEPYQYFFRISGSTPSTPNIAVDLDLDNHVWRMLHLDQPDLINSWSARNYTRELDTPIYHRQSYIPTSTLIKSGTWTHPTNLTYHSLSIPELDLIVPHFYEFTGSCAFEPFLKIHRTTNLTGPETSQIHESRWNKYNEDTAVMRTANFGHSQQRTDICIQHGDWEGENGTIYPGLGENMLVPLGLVASYRLRMWGEGTRTFCFDDYAPYWKLE